ncbi:unnamed protein product [Camellia sinensis]
MHAEIATGHYKGRPVFIPKIPLELAKMDNVPFPFERKQFPMRSCFAMTINESQGQTLGNVGIYPPQPVFSHGQLYVALSRAQRKMANNIMTIDQLTDCTRTWKAQLRVVKKQAPHTLNSGTTIQRLILADTKLPIAASVIHVLPSRTITKHMDGSSTQVQDLLLLDDSLHPIKLSAQDEFTSNECEQIASNIIQQPAVIMTKLRATKFNGKKLAD